MNRRHTDPKYRIARPDQVGYSDALNDFKATFASADEPHPLTHDLDEVNLATFDVPRADGFVDPGEAELQVARDGVADLQWQHVTESTRRNREATPVPALVGHEGSEL